MGRDGARGFCATASRPWQARKSPQTLKPPSRAQNNHAFHPHFTSQENGSLVVTGRRSWGTCRQSCRCLQKRPFLTTPVMAHGSWCPFSRYGNLDANHTSLNFEASRSSSRRVSLSVLPLLSLPLHSLAKSDPVPGNFPPQPVRSRSSRPPTPGLQGNGNGGRCPLLRSRSGKIFDMPWTRTPTPQPMAFARSARVQTVNLTVPPAPLNSHITITNACL